MPIFFYCLKKDRCDFLHDKASRICSSLIDVVMVSTPDLVHESGIMTHTISDHLPVYVMLKLKRPKPPPSYVRVRSYKKYNSELFSIDLASKSDQILPIFTENDVNTKLSMFNKVFLPTLERHAPVMTIKVRNRLCPYVTQEIKVLMNERDELHRKFQLSRDIKDWQAYKDARNSAKNVLKDCEKIMYVMKLILIKTTLDPCGKL